MTFDLELAREPAVIEADPGQLQQVVMNLITNASEAIADRPGTVTLTTGVVHCDERYLSRSRLEWKPAPGRFVVLEVADTGCGMSQGTLDRLFEPFFSTKFTGRGLGMPVVMGIVRGHGGAILVDSVIGRGSAIRVLFPAPGEARTGDATARSHLPAKPVTSERSCVILVVEGDAAVRELCRQYLDEIGYECLVAASGEEALDLFDSATDRIVAVLLDLSMPGMDGVATFHELTRRRPDLKVLMMSGFSESDTARRFSGATPVAFLQKPFRLADLGAKIQGLFAAR